MVAYMQQQIRIWDDVTVAIIKCAGHQNDCHETIIFKIYHSIILMGFQSKTECITKRLISSVEWGVLES